MTGIPVVVRTAGKDVPGWVRFTRVKRNGRRDVDAFVPFEHLNTTQKRAVLAYLAAHTPELLPYPPRRR